VITGAAGAFAEPIADRLAHEGATVVGVDRREQTVGTHRLQSDLTDEDQVKELFAQVKQDLGRIDVGSPGTGRLIPLRNRPARRSRPCAL
jgi:NAD(P)-dependent dehydrogenase (short-subunit alcohol dehydrogenase family)